MHSHRHVFDDIEAKGVSKNFNSKHGEKHHGPLKDYYAYQTNFKNVAPQVSKKSFDSIYSNKKFSF